MFISPFDEPYDNPKHKKAKIQALCKMLDEYIAEEHKAHTVDYPRLLKALTQAMYEDPSLRPVISNAAWLISPGILNDEAKHEKYLKGIKAELCKKIK